MPIRRSGSLCHGREQRIAVYLQRLRSYFAIFGNLFGFKNFGKLVAADNIFNSLFGLLQVGPVSCQCLCAAVNGAAVVNALSFFIWMPPGAVPPHPRGVESQLHVDQHLASRGRSAAFHVCVLHVPLGELRPSPNSVRTLSLSSHND